MSSIQPSKEVIECRSRADQDAARNHVIAINPIDYMQADMGIMIQDWPKVLGSDVAGEVYEVGANVNRFKKGDRVAGEAQGLAKGTPEEGAYSLYTRLPAKTASILPPTVSFKEAAGLGMAIATASCGLNGEDYLAQPFPSANPAPSGKVIMVYGGSTSIGSMTTQLATAAGIRVIALASPKNFDFCRKCGASDVFDYKDSNVVGEVVKAVGKDHFVGIFVRIWHITPV